MMDTNSVLALAQQIQDIKDGWAAIKSLLAGSGVTIGALLALAYKFRDKFLNRAVVAHIEAVAEQAVENGQGMAAQITANKTGTGDGTKPV